MVACALAAGGIASALIVPSSAVAGGNIIGAGHLRISVNQGDDANLAFTNLLPGEAATGDQLITADMGGVDQADLTLTLSGAPTGAFADAASLTVAYSDPQRAGDVTWTNGTCTPTGGYVHQVTIARLSDLATAQANPLGTLTHSAAALCVRFTLAFAATAGNDTQGAHTGIDVSYSLTQSGGAP